MIRRAVALLARRVLLPAATRVFRAPDVRGLRCKLSGHRWRVTTPAGISAAPCMECRRCDRVGWLV